MVLTSCQCFDLQDLPSFFADFGKQAVKIFFIYAQISLHGSNYTALSVLHFGGVEILFLFVALTDFRGTLAGFQDMMFVLLYDIAKW